MIKFVHKKHSQRSNGSKFVIYYSLSDIVLGLLLMGLVSFFAYNYIKFETHPLGPNISLYSNLPGHVINNQK